MLAACDLRADHLVLEKEFGSVLDKVTYTIMKDHDQKHLWKVEGFYCVFLWCFWLTYSKSQPIVESQGRKANWARTWRHELLQVPWKSAAYCLFLTGSACFHIESRTTNPWVAPPTIGGALPHQLLINKMPWRLEYKCNFWIYVLSSQMVLTCVKLIYNYSSQGFFPGEDQGRPFLHSYILFCL